TALSSASQNARSVLRSTNLEAYFDVILDGNQVKKQKPDPSCFLLAAQALGLSPAECLVFEDSPPGIEAAIRGGFTAIGVGKPEELANAHLVIHGFENLTFNTLLTQILERAES
ncbi:MAG: HAD-IA family hydrolase, partial [Thermoanaerobaculia bacterium]|nr:HAD-IA family hydrolase [Thermoanaerobaculia bacterium]